MDESTLLNAASKPFYNATESSRTALCENVNEFEQFSTESADTGVTHTTFNIHTYVANHSLEQHNVISQCVESSRQNDDKTNTRDMAYAPYNNNVDYEKCSDITNKESNKTHVTDEREESRYIAACQGLDNDTFTSQEDILHVNETSQILKQEKNDERVRSSHDQERHVKDAGIINQSGDTGADVGVCCSCSCGVHRYVVLLFICLVGIGNYIVV